MLLSFNWFYRERTVVQEDSVCLSCWVKDTVQGAEWIPLGKGMHSGYVYECYLLWKSICPILISFIFVYLSCWKFQVIKQVNKKMQFLNDFIYLRKKLSNLIWICQKIVAPSVSKSTNEINLIDNWVQFHSLSGNVK